MSLSSEATFLAALAKEMAANQFNNHSGNYDAAQLGEEPPPMKEQPMWLRLTKEAYGGLIASLQRIYDYYFNPKRFYAKDAEAYKDVFFLYTFAGNERSKELVLKLCAYRAQGHRKVVLPRNNDQYWQNMEIAAELKTNAESIKIKYMGASLGLYDCSAIGYDMKVYATVPGLACALLQKQYEYHDPKKGVCCKAEPGDVAIDAGGCWGETTVYFAHEVGPEGRAIVFEFIPSNLAVLEANLRANPVLARRIKVIPNPIWKTSGLKLYYVDDGPGSRLTDDKAAYKYDGVVETITIDDMVAQQNLPRVDFIKMDIEGAELSALKGAENTIRRFTPKLAVSLYHHIGDFTTIPRYIYSLGLEYDFFVDHHTIYENETILFAVPNQRRIAEKIGMSFEAYMDAGGRPPETAGSLGRG